MDSRWLALALIFVTRTSMGVQFQSIASVGPLIVTDLGLSYAQVGTLLGLYLLPGVALALPGGLLGQRLGGRRALVGSLAVMVVGGLVTAWSDGFAGAAVGRVLSGSGAVLMNILLVKVTADWFAGREMATAMAVMLTAWPVGLGLAAASLGGLATATSWRTSLVVAAAPAALGLVLMASVFREAPQRAAPGARAALRARDTGLALASGLAWGVFNASLVAVIAFGPAMLVARGVSLGQAGFEVSLAIWVTIVSVPLGGVLSARVGRPNAFIVGGSLAGAAPPRRRDPRGHEPAAVVIAVVGHEVLHRGVPRRDDPGRAVDAEVALLGDVALHLPDDVAPLRDVERAALEPDHLGQLAVVHAEDVEGRLGQEELRQITVGLREDRAQPRHHLVELAEDRGRDVRAVPLHVEPRVESRVLPVAHQDLDVVHEVRTEPGRRVDGRLEAVRIAGGREQPLCLRGVELVILAALGAELVDRDRPFAERGRHHALRHVVTERERVGVEDVREAGRA